MNKTETTQHTAGPWTVEKSQLHDGEPRVVSRDVSLPVVGWLNPTSPDFEANARLIVAAPELLEALKSLTVPGVTAEKVQRAQSAIAKATGAQP